MSSFKSNNSTVSYGYLEINYSSYVLNIELDSYYSTEHPQQHCWG